MPRTTEPTLTYLSIVNNKICERYGTTTDRANAQLNMPEGANNCREHFDDKGEYVKTIWERVDGQIEGVIIAIDYDDTGEFGAIWKIKLSDFAEVYSLQLAEISQRAGQLWKKFKGLDPSKPVKFTPWGKKGEYSGWTISQGDVDLDWFITAEKPDGFPPLPEELEGKDWEKYTTDDKDDYKKVQIARRQFFRKYVNEELIPLLKSPEVQLGYAETAYSKTEPKFENLEEKLPESETMGPSAEFENNGPPKQNMDQIPPEAEEDDLPF